RISRQVGGSVETSSGVIWATKSRANATSSCHVRAARISLCQLIGSPCRNTLPPGGNVPQSSPGGAGAYVSVVLRDVGQTRQTASKPSDNTSQRGPTNAART